VILVSCIFVSVYAVGSVMRMYAVHES